MKTNLADIRNYLNDETPILDGQLRQVMAMVKQYGKQCKDKGFSDGYDVGNHMRESQ